MFQRTPLHARRDDGATAVEYGLILGGVVLATAVCVMKVELQNSSTQQAVLTTGVTATASP